MVVVSHPTWILGNKLGSSGETGVFLTSELPENSFSNKNLARLLAGRWAQVSLVDQLLVSSLPSLIFLACGPLPDFRV